MKLSLAMIVRDAAESLPACLESVLPHIDAYCIHDTGSEDDTIKIAQAYLGDLPGRIDQLPWVGFAKNRTDLIQAAGAYGEYVIMIDSDHVVTTHAPLPELTLDSYQVKIEDEWGGWLPLITKAGMPFYYEGAAHAYLKCSQPVTEAKLREISVQGGPGATREKLERDRDALLLELRSGPPNPRTVFYLAQTFRDLGEPEAAIEFYRMRAGMEGFEEERFFAQYQLGVLLGENVGIVAGAKALIEAFEMRPTRAEPLRALARLSDSAADKISVPDDTLFVMPGAYKEEQ